MSNSLKSEFALAISEGLQSRALTTCSRWAARRRIMSGDFAGPYSWKHHPWVKGMHDSEAPFNYAMKGAQLGVTEVAINRALYTIDKLKRDVLYVLPTALNASDFSKARFGVALNNSPYLKSIFTDTDTVNLKQAGSNTLYIRGSRGDSNLKSIPVSELILDEVDEMDQKQIWLALERLSGQLTKHVWALSTPTIPNHGIHLLYKNSTQEHFIFRCPGCSRRTELVWPECVEIIGESVDDPRCRESFLKCKECGCKLDQKAKPDFLKSAEWFAQNLQADTDVRGFYVNQLYSFTVSAGELVTSYFRGFGDELATKEFHNSKLGLPFIGEGAQITEDEVKACVGVHSMQDLRPESSNRIITLGVDQGKWSYAEVIEWEIPEWVKGVNLIAKAKQLWAGRFYEDEWDTVLNKLMFEWQIRGAVIDADPNRLEASRFSRTFPGFVWLCQYRAGVTAKEISIAEYADGVPIATVDRTSWMSQSLGRFRTKTITLARDCPREYMEHVQAPVRTYVRDKNNNPVARFVSTAADHYAHARNYSEIALPLIGARETNSDISEFI